MYKAGQARRQHKVRHDEEEDIEDMRGAYFKVCGSTFVVCCID